VNLFKAFASSDVKLEVDGEDVVDQDLLNDVESFAGDLLSPFGVNLVCGTEYHFSDTFNLGGEYGFYYMMSASEMEVMQEGEDWTGYDWRLTTTVHAFTNPGHTCAAITANFVF
jgi:hypothetical protein